MNILKEEVGQLLFLFARGRRTYDSYISDDNKFIYARILKENNDDIKKLLKGVSHNFPRDVLEESVELIHHIDVWSELWVNLKSKTNPQLEDKFVFENKINYPKLVEEKIRRFYLSL